MTRFLPIVALLLPAACATPPPAPSGPPDSPIQATCRAESRSDPAVKAVQSQLNMGNSVNEQRVGYETRVAELRVFRDCMRRNGVALPGGVEAVRPLR
jgi:starvation-inducible outer membrane lipoprotein